MNEGHRQRRYGVALAGACLLVSGASVASVAAPAEAASTKLFAGAQASGAANCTTAANACPLAKALGAVRPGGIVELVTPGHEGAASSYYSAGSSGFSVATSGTSAALPVVIEAAAGVETPILDGGGKHSILTVGNMHLEVRGLVFQNGYGDASTSGGGITNDSRAMLTVAGADFADNFSPQDGGAIQNGPGGTLTVTDSTFSGNSACLGAAVVNGYRGSGTATIARSTFSGNRAFCQGGAVANGNRSSGRLTITDSTFWGNTAPDGAAIENGDGGSGRLTITGSTLSGNRATSDNAAIDNGGGSGTPTIIAAADIIAGSCRQTSGTWIDMGDNVASSASCLRGGKGDTPNTNLSGLLGPLADNGGPTQTMALLPGNLASGLIPDPTSGLCPVATDQTGRPGPPGAPCNAGALQLHPTISSVALADTGETPSVTITGTGFGTKANLGPPTPAATCSGGTATGDDYPSTLYLSEQTGRWSAGQGPPSACDYYGLVFSSYSSTQITFTFSSVYPKYGNMEPGDAIAIHVLGAAFSRTVDFPPAITSFSPASGRVGATVTIRGANLARASKVTFDGVRATITSDTGSRITVKVPKRAKTGRVHVTTAGGSVASATVFTVT